MGIIFKYIEHIGVMYIIDQFFACRNGKSPVRFPYDHAAMHV